MAKKSRFESAEQWMLKREIDRINRQIKQAFTKLGSESRLAKQYETILLGSEKAATRDSLMHRKALNLRTGNLEPLIRQTKEGIPQISTGKASLMEFGTITAMQKQLKMLGRMQTVQNAQKQMVSAWETKKGLERGTLKTREQKKQAIYEELEEYKASEQFRGTFLQPLYDYEKKHGVKLKALQEIRDKSKGRWTSKEEYAELKVIAMQANEDIKNERAEIIRDVFGQNQW